MLANHILFLMHTHTHTLFVVVVTQLHSNFFNLTVLRHTLFFTYYSKLLQVNKSTKVHHISEWFYCSRFINDRLSVQWFCLPGPAGLDLLVFGLDGIDGRRQCVGWVEFDVRNRARRLDNLTVGILNTVAN